MRKIINGILAFCCLLVIGCERKDVTPEASDPVYAAMIKDAIDGVCNGSGSCDCGRDIMQSIVSMTNDSARMMHTRMVVEAMSKATFCGSDVHDRENSQARFHSFREKMSEPLYGGKCWDVILELWFAEVESMKKEAEFCRHMMKRSPFEFINQGETQHGAMPPDWEEQWYTSARHSESIFMIGMAPIVLWDDSVAAKYCATLSQGEKMKVVRRIKDAIGRYPDWYLDEQKNGKKSAHEEAVRKPRDGGDVLPHPFTIFGCTLGKVYDQDKRLGMSHNGRTIDSLLKNFRIDQYFGKDCVIARLAPRAKVAYSLEIEWQDVKTKADMLARVKDIKADIEKRLGVTLGGLFFEVDGHVCDESKWWSAPSAFVKSRSVFGPILIEICAACKDRGTSYVKLEIIDMVAEALVKKERKENPLKYDREAERRRFERLKELSRRRKAMKDAKKAKQPQP